MNNLIPFNYNSKQVRTVIKDGEPWFVAADVCNILEHSNYRMAVEGLDSDERDVSKVYTPGGEQEMIVVNEAGLYSMVIRSNKPEAKPFRKWVTGEVLPSIRKHGMYAKDELLDNPDLLIEVATKLKEERQLRIAAEQTIEQQKPLVMFAETCIASNDSLLVREVAKLASKQGVIIGEKRLWQKLREWEVVSPSNEPYQRAFDAGWFEVKQGTYSTPYGADTYRTYLVKPKGQIHIIERLKREMAN